MHGWIQKLWKSKISSREQEAMVTNKSASSHLPPSSTFSSSSSSSSSLGLTPSEPPQPHSAMSSLQRWSRKYDVFVCHSSVHSDIEEAVRLVSYLESSPRSLRCFLTHRDACPGGAISTELCQAVQDSHIRALLITPDFLQDDWCKYMMHQVLAEAPMSNRIIPLVQNLTHSQYPQELKFYFYIDLGRNPNRGYSQVNTTVLKYLKDLPKNEKTLDGQHGQLSSEGSSQKDTLVSKYDPTDTCTGSTREETKASMEFIPPSPHSGGTNFPLTSGQRSRCPSFDAG